MSKRNLTEKVAMCDELDFASQEAYNVVRTNLAFTLHSKKKCKVVGITSTAPQEGKSFTAVNLAYSLAKNGIKVLLIGGDLRKPSLEKKMGFHAEKGISNYLCGEVGLEEIIVHNVKHENLSVITSGTIPPNPTELLGSDEMNDMIVRLSENYEYILIDLPPVGIVIDAVSIKNCIEGLLVVIRHGFTQKKSVRKTLSQIDFAGIRILGFVYNCAGDKYHRNFGRSYYKYEY